MIDRWTWAPLALASVIVAACAAPTPSPLPTPIATPDCFEFIDPATPSTINGRDLLDYAETVIVGTFEGYDDAAWNTPDGERPTRDGFGNGARLVTPLRIEVQRALRGDPATASKAVEAGGVSGCDVVDYGPTHVRVGGQYVFMLWPLVDSTGAPSDHLLLLDAWPVDQDGRVSSSDGRLSDLKDIERRIRRTDGP